MCVVQHMMSRIYIYSKTRTRTKIRRIWVNKESRYSENYVLNCTKPKKVARTLFIVHCSGTPSGGCVVGRCW